MLVDAVKVTLFQSILPLPGSPDNDTVFAS